MVGADNIVESTECCGYSGLHMKRKLCGKEEDPELLLQDPKNMLNDVSVRVGWNLALAYVLRPCC